MRQKLGKKIKDIYSIRLKRTSNAKLSNILSFQMIYNGLIFISFELAC